MDENLAAQAELALERQGEYDSLCYEGQWHTNGQLAERAARLATGFAELGVRPGDRLLVLMANCPEVLITYTAAWRTGAVVTPLIFLVSEDELRHALIDSGAVGIVTTVEFLRKVAAAVAGASGVRFVVVPGATAETQGEAAPGVPVLDFAQVASAAPGPVASRSGTDLAALLYTGGTTGRSRGGPLTHANLYWCGSAAHESSTRAHVMSSILPLPLAHAYGLLVLCGGMHRTDQATTILMRWFDPARWLKLAEQHRVQGSALVPSMIQMLLAQPLEQADLSELITISSGAAPLAADVRREFEARAARPAAPADRLAGGRRREDLAGDLTEAYPRSAARGGGGDRHLVLVLQEGPDGPIGQGQRFRAAPAQFQQAAALAPVRAADGT